MRQLDLVLLYDALLKLSSEVVHPEVVAVRYGVQNQDDGTEKQEEEQIYHKPGFVSELRELNSF